jgi:hypothetical protein
MSIFHALRHVMGAVMFRSAFSHFSCIRPMLFSFPCIPYLCHTMLEGVAILGPYTLVTHSAGGPDDGVRLTLLLANWIL